MFITLYTSRILLEELGAADFGLYHVIAGFVVLAAFLQGSLSGATQRFVAFELGRDSTGKISDIFTMSVNIHIIFSLIIITIGGVIGTLMLPNILVYESGRESAILWVFWFSLISFGINIIIVPYHSIIIAHEEMKVFAWVSILDAFLRLAAVFVIQFISYDPLITYSILVCGNALIVGAIYYFYVYNKYKNIRYSRHWDTTQFKKLTSFAGWTIWGNAASVFSNQGLNVLLNIYFGPVINAAKSVGNQASGALNKFVTNLQMAINPQIIKSYSGNDRLYTSMLVNYGSKYNFFLIITLAMPILIRTDDVLSLWLVTPPPLAALFLRLILINAIIESISRPLITAAQATGDIKYYQLIVGGILLLNLPISYYLLELGHPSHSVLIVTICLTIIASVARIVMLKRIFDFSFKRFFVESLARIIFVTIILAFILSKISSFYRSSLSLTEMVIFSSLSVLTALVVVYIFGLEARERRQIRNILRI